MRSAIGLLARGTAEADAEVVCMLSAPPERVQIGQAPLPVPDPKVAAVRSLGESTLPEMASDVRSGGSGGAGDPAEALWGLSECAEEGAAHPLGVAEAGLAGDDVDGAG